MGTNAFLALTRNTPFLFRRRREFPEDFQQEMYDLIMSRFVRVLDPEKCGLPKVLGYVEVSCKTRHNIRKLANFIYDSVFDLRSQQGSSKLLLEEKIPATYLALEDVIANIARGLFCGCVSGMEGSLGSRERNKW